MEETKRMKPTDKALLRRVSESSGRNASEREIGLESAKVRRPSLPRRGEGSMGSRTLTETAVPLRRGRHDGMMARAG